MLWEEDRHNSWGGLLQVSLDIESTVSFSPSTNSIGSSVSNATIISLPVMTVPIMTAVLTVMAVMIVMAVLTAMAELTVMAVLIEIVG